MKYFKGKFVKKQYMIFIKVLALGLFSQGCTLKNAYQPRIPKKPIPTLHQPITPKAVVEQSIPDAVKPSSMIITPPHKNEIKNAFSHPKTMRFSTLNGKHISIKADANLLQVTNPEYQGKDVVLYLFGRDCPHCQNETAKIRQLAQNPNIKIIGIHAQKMIGNAALKTYAQKVGYHFDILSFDNDVALLKYLDYQGIWAGGTPAHLLIDSGGYVQEMRITDLLNR